ncbi:MAG: uroporphyrinogen decarboxylase family protein, partial [Candidatus Omnitrophica bacterium]|nr:uroporphyrinogen decarboxylase family protein [Candidatus Omnitrophota bacterium]
AGNVDCAKTLVSGTKEDIEKEVIECIRDAGKGGGLILTSSNSIHYNVPARNFLYMLEAARKYGKYPFNKN